MHFSGGKERTNFLLGEFCTVRVYQGEESFLMENFSGKILNWGNSPEFLYEIHFVCLAFFSPTEVYAWTC